MFQRAPLAPRRRAILLAAASSVALPAAAQPVRGAGRPVTVAQIVDTSAAQQDVSKDFLVGSRAAWQDINARGGLRGRPVTHRTVEVDGTRAATRSAVAALAADPACLVLTGTAGDPVATAVADALQQQAIALAHVAPWLQNSAVEADERTFPIFANRQDQIVHAFRSLSAMGVQDLGVVYATEGEAALHRQELDRLGATLKLRVQPYRGGGDLTRLGGQLNAASPAILLFIGGTPELVQFTQGLERQQRQRYVIALADVNLQTLQQMGGARATPVIATQAVPLVTASLPVVRAYRDTLARLFDEPPAPLSLAGYIAARATAEVLAELDGTPTRAAALTAFQRRAALDLGGFRVGFDGRRRGAAYVTQSLLTADGRVLG